MLLKASFLLTAISGHAAVPITETGAVGRRRPGILAGRTLCHGDPVGPRGQQFDDDRELPVRSGRSIQAWDLSTLATIRSVHVLTALS